MRERRRFLRLENNVPVKYSKALKSIDKEYFKEAGKGNIGGGGIKLALKEKLSLGTILILKIDLPSDSGPLPIFATGEVIWNKEVKEGKYESGIKFLKIKKKDRERIIHYVEKQVVSK